MYCSTMLLEVQQEALSMMNQKKIFFLFILTLLSYPLYAQIVNVESLRIQTDTTGFAGNVGGDFTITKDVAQIFSANAYATIQYKSKKNTYLLLGNYSFLRGADKKLLNKLFTHFRYDRKITRFFRMEGFTQLQFNKITKIDTRFLIGAGPRFKIPTRDKWKTYVGILFMYEYEKELTDPIIYHHVVRNSSYLSFTFTPNDIVKLVSTTFYQPKIDEFSDFRILNQESIEFSISKKLSATMNWSYLYDARPVAGIPNSNYTFSTGIKYEFNP